jgi:hypothetical protein
MELCESVDVTGYVACRIAGRGILVYIKAFRIISLLLLKTKCPNEYILPIFPKVTPA